MITREIKTTNVQFGKNGIGSVSLRAERGRLTIQQIINERKIGDHCNIEDIQELPKVVLNFNQTSSIETMIKVLEEVKRRMETPDPLQFAEAC